MNGPKLFFTNDLILLGYSLGLTNKLNPNENEKILAAIWQDWDMTNNKMEDTHNYVQAWFPIFSVGQGNGRKTQRLSPTLIYNLENTKCSEYLNQMNQITFARMTTFWGQKIDGEKLSTVEVTWHQNWLTNTHNDLRMTRILKWLLMFRREDEYKMMQAYLSTSKKNSFWDDNGLQQDIATLKLMLRKKA